MFNLITKFQVFLQRIQGLLEVVYLVVIYIQPFH
jgi:hypothetical protein